MYIYNISLQQSLTCCHGCVRGGDMRECLAISTGNATKAETGTRHWFLDIYMVCGPWFNIFREVWADNSVSSLWACSSFTWCCLAISFGRKVGEQSSSHILCLEVLQFYTSTNLNERTKTGWTAPPAAAAALVQTLSGFTSSLWSRLVSFASCNQPLWLLRHMCCCIKKSLLKKEAEKETRCCRGIKHKGPHSDISASRACSFLLSLRDQQKMWDW